MRDTLKQALDGKLAAAGTAVRDIIVDKMYRTELDVRTEATYKVVAAIDRIDMELTKIKPKSPGFDGEGAQLPAQYSTQDFSRRKQLTEKRAVLDAALDAALVENGSFEKLLKEAANADKVEGGGNSSRE